MDGDFGEFLGCLIYFGFLVAASAFIILFLYLLLQTGGIL